MHSQRILRDELRKILSEKSNKDLAKKAGIHATALSQFLGRKRNVSQKFAEKHFRNLLPEEIWKKVETEYELERVGKPIDVVSLEFKPPTNEEELEKYKDELKFVGDNPLHATLVVLAERQDYQPTLKWICSQVPFEESSVKEGLDRLSRWGFLRKENGRYLKTGRRWTTVKGKEPDVSVHRRARDEFIKIENKHFGCGSESKSDYCTRVMAVHPKDIPKFKRLSREFMQRVEKLQLRSEAKQVYALTLSFFPVSK